MGSAGWQWLAEEGGRAGGAEPLGPVLAGLLGPAGTPWGSMGPSLLTAQKPWGRGGRALDKRRSRGDPGGRGLVDSRGAAGAGRTAAQSVLLRALPPGAAAVGLGPPRPT